MDPALLDPRSTWADPAAYDAMADRLAGMFADNFEAYADGVTPDVRAAGPRVAPGSGSEGPRDFDSISG